MNQKKKKKKTPKPNQKFPIIILELPQHAMAYDKPANTMNEIKCLVKIKTSMAPSDYGGVLQT